MNIPKKSIDKAVVFLKSVLDETPLQYSRRLSARYGAQIYLKREDLTMVRSFKIRGAYYKMSSLTTAQKKKGVVCASAGNHAQGVAYACTQLKVKGVIYMPVTTPNQKVEKVKNFGGKYVEIKLYGNTFDEAKVEAQRYCTRHGATLIHPFDDVDVIAGQGSVAYEIAEQYAEVMKKMSDADTKKSRNVSAKSAPPAESIDYVVCCVGGGGLISGVSSYFKHTSPSTKVVGSEPEYADCMNKGLIAGHPVTLDRFETFVDGAAVRTVGTNTLAIAQECVNSVVVCPVGLVCSTMIELYQSEGIVTEPAGALAVAALELIKHDIKGKSVVCVVSGGNNDLLRYPEILEKSLVYRGLKHYFLIEFAQKPGQLRDFLNKALGKDDDIVLFEYLKKTNKERGPALVGIELKNSDDLAPLLKKMEKIGLSYKKITSDDLVFNLLV
ncbi:MAG: threonine ammonia-lyase IlvA [Candidatus Roizmanbacteria bacterium]